jgi:threonine efflux protein
MSYIPELAAIALVFLLVCLSPGPSFLIISSTAISASRRAGILVGMGVAAASLTWATAAMLGLGLLLAQATSIYNILRVLGAAYLIYLGVRMVWGARRTRILAEQPLVQSRTPMRYFTGGYLLAASNPTAAIFFGSVFSAMLPPAAPTWVYVATVVLVTLVSAAWHCGIAIVFSIPSFQQAYRRWRRGIDTLAGTLLILLGLRLAILS